MTEPKRSGETKKSLTLEADIPFIQQRIPQGKRGLAGVTSDNFELERER